MRDPSSRLRKILLVLLAFFAAWAALVFVTGGIEWRVAGVLFRSRDPARATYSDLENALGDLLANRSVRVPETTPFGCAIVR